MNRIAVSLCLVSLLTAFAAAGDTPPAKETADEFVARANRELLESGKEYAQASWVQLTYITPDTEAMASKAYERYLGVNAKLIAESKAHAGEKMSPESARAIEILKLGLPAPAPEDAAKRTEIAEVETRMTSMYGAGKWCPKGPDSCQNIDDISKTLATSRDYDVELEAWKGWHENGAARSARTISASSRS